jgi:hypothetical protein
MTFKKEDKMTFKKVDTIYSSDLYYDLFDGGYINPEELLEYEDEAVIVMDAINIIKEFLNEAVSNNIIEVG